MIVDRLVVASKNPDKISEVEAVLFGLEAVGEIVHSFDWPDVDETGSTLRENALIKARAVVAATGIAAIADDTGLFVEALGGAPGIYSARYAGKTATYDDNVSKLLAELDGTERRAARFSTAVALIRTDGSELTIEGHLDGTIIRERRGTNGFGYDPVFEVDGRTLAEMTAEEKNLYSHRSRALRALVSTLSVC